MRARRDLLVQRSHGIELAALDEDRGARLDVHEAAVEALGGRCVETLMDRRR